MKPISLTPWQKLHALSYRFYQFQTWTPKAGDRYTTSRADLELYEVISVDDGVVTTRYSDPARGDQISIWSQDEFLSPKTFGANRVWVPDWILEKEFFHG